MDIVILLYPRFTALDAVGPYEVLRNLPGATVTFVAKEVGPVRTDSGALAITADAAIRDVPSADVVVVPGGPGQADFMQDAEILDWLRAIHETTQWTTSVCTGSLLLGAAGLLDGLQATSHWTALDHLPTFGASPTLMRVVEQGKVITAAGDLGGQAIQLGIEYDPQPPFDAGSPAKAPKHIVEMLQGMSRFAVPEGV